MIFDNSGWVKIHRKILHSPIFDNANLLKVWFWCLCKATHEPRKHLVGNQLVELEAGQFVFGRKSAALDLKMKERTVYDYMNVLEKLEMLNIKSTNKFSVVTVMKWDFYQGRDDVDQQQKDNNPTTIQHQSNNSPTTVQHKQECKELKNVKNVKNISPPNISPPRGDASQRFTPPSVDEVRAYCQERRNGVDPQAFVDFYTSKGWMVGKNKMKDWRAAVRNWERKEEHRGTGKNQRDTEPKVRYGDHW